MSKDQTEALQELARAMRDIADHIDRLIAPTPGVDPPREESVLNSLGELAAGITLYVSEAPRDGIPA